jgi:hypothetical protein
VTTTISFDALTSSAAAPPGTTIAWRIAALPKLQYYLGGSTPGKARPIKLTRSQ